MEELESDTQESSQSSTIIEYIYDDEILPEIEIREVISIDTFLKENPKFVAIDQETILVLLKQLFTNDVKAKGFFNLHKNVIRDKEVDILAHIFVHIDAIRKNNEDLTLYFEEQDRAKHAPTFELQQFELNKLRYPFEPEKIIQDKQYILNEPSHIIIKNKDSSPYTPIDISKTLVNDDISLPILGAYWKLSSIYKLLYLHESNTIEPFIYTKWKDIPNELELSYDDWLKKFVQPKFKDTLSKIISIESLHTYTILLANAGYDINNLSIYQDKLLRRHLEQLLENSNDEDNISKKTKHFPKIEYIYPLLNFLDSIQKHNDRYSAYFQEERLFRIQENLGSYISSLPNFQNEIDTSDPYTLATQVIQGTRTLEEIKTIINQLHIRSQFNKANSLLKQLAQSKSYISLDKYKTIFNNITKSIIDEIREPFISLYNDIHDIVIGNDTSKYDGTPSTILETIYEETQYEIITLDEKEEISPEEEIYDSLPDELNEQFSELQNSHDGVKEILNYILPYLIKIRDASALPWNINSWIKIYNADIQRQSRMYKIQQEIEDINPYILQRICINSLDNSMQIISELNNIQIADKLKSIYPSIYSEWKDDCKEAFFHALTLWLLDLLELSLNGNLDFSILNGMISYAELWSPYGPPLIEKKTSNGIIFYISAISAILLPYDIQSNIIEDKLLHISIDKYKERVEKLRDLWNKIKDKQEKQDKATQAKLSLIEASRKLLAKEKINYLSTYVKAYYYLPTFIPKKDMIAFKKQPIWAQGCCLSKLDDSYEADNDWKNHIKPLWSMKNKLAEDRWLVTPRENLKLIKLNKEQIENNKQLFEKQTNCFIESKDELEETQIKFIPNDIWIQKSHYDILYREAREGSSTLIKQCIQLAYQRIKADNILNIIDSLFQLNDIQHILIKLIKNTFIKLKTVNTTSIEYRILENTKTILFDMKNILHLFLNAKGIEYTACIYRARYILARALCLPGIPQNNKLSVPDNVSSTFYANILRDNFNIITDWYKNNSMLTPSEIQAYITKMREEQKKTTLSKLDVLSVDDMQLMKDMKRFGLINILEKTTPTEKVEVDTNQVNNDDTGVNIPINEDQDGEAEWLQPSTDQDVQDEDILDSVL